jgi:UDP-glucose 4-epimerase
MRCLVLGGAGFIGEHLVRQLQADGVSVVVGDVDVTPASHARTVDLRRRASLRAGLQGIDCVVHLAWNSVPATTATQAADDARQNLLGSLRLFDCCLAAGVRRVVFCSSGGAIYGRAQTLPIPEDHPTVPLMSYGVTKLATEGYLRFYSRSHGLDHVILRPGNAYGEGQRSRRSQGLVAACLTAAASERPVEVWGDGTVVRDYVHVADIARALSMATRTAASGETYNIGTGTGHSVNAIIDLCRQVSGRPVSVEYRAGRAFDAHDNVLDWSRARARLGWSPTVALREGIERQWRALLAQALAAPDALPCVPGGRPVSVRDRR